MGTGENRNLSLTPQNVSWPYLLRDNACSPQNPSHQKFEPIRTASQTRQSRRARRARRRTKAHIAHQCLTNNLTLFKLLRPAARPPVSSRWKQRNMAPAPSRGILHRIASHCGHTTYSRVPFAGESGRPHN